MTIIDRCRQPAFVEWRSGCSEGSGPSEIVLANGKTRTIFRCDALPNIGDVKRVKTGRYISGDTSNRACTRPERFYSRNMSVNALVGLAAYTIHIAHEIAPEYVKGLDIAVYRDTTGAFELIEDVEIDGNLALEFEEMIRGSMESHFTQAVLKSPRHDP